jgi:hypothetical protein
MMSVSPKSPEVERHVSRRGRVPRMSYLGRPALLKQRKCQNRHPVTSRLTLMRVSPAAKAPREMATLNRDTVTRHAKKCPRQIWFFKSLTENNDAETSTPEFETRTWINETIGHQGTANFN